MSWFLKVVENGTAPYREAYGPFTTARAAGSYIYQVEKDYVKLPGVLKRDLTLLSYKVEHENVEAVREWTEDGEITKPPNY